MLNRNISIPLYEQLKNIIEHKINTNEYKVNEQIPSERELCEMYNVSRITVRQAIALAEKEGLVSRVHGVGTFVAKPKIHQELNTIVDFQSTVSKSGLIASTKLIKTNVITSDFKLSRLLNINIMEKIQNLQLVGYGDDSPIVYYNTFFPYELGEQIKQATVKLIDNNLPFSTLDLYKEHTNYRPTHVEQTFEAINAHEQIAEILKIEVGFPLLRVTSIVYQESTPLEYKETYYRGDKYRFFITRKINLDATEY